MKLVVDTYPDCQIIVSTKNGIRMYFDLMVRYLSPCLVKLLILDESGAKRELVRLRRVTNNGRNLLRAFRGIYLRRRS